MNTINRMTDNRPALFALWYLLTFGALYAEPIARWITSR